MAHSRKERAIGQNTNLGLIQGFPQLVLLKRELGIMTIGELEAKTETWLIAENIDVEGLKNFLFNSKGYQVTFAL